MPFIDVSMLLQPVHPDAPCGPDLEYSPLYLEAARAFEGTPDVQYGSLCVAAVEPDWKRVKSATLELLSRSRDLRLAVWLTRALLALHGIAGMAEGLSLIEGLLARHWDRLHPQLEASDDFDPTARINALLCLDDKAGFVREVGLATLVESPHHGRLCLRDIDAAEGDARPDAAQIAPAHLDVDAAFAGAALNEVVEMCDMLAAAKSSLERIDRWLTERIGHRRAVTLAALDEVLRRAEQWMRGQLARHPARAAHRNITSVGAASAIAQASGGGFGPAAGGTSDITCRDDVVRMLEYLCGYYADVEPSSPVPVLLQRARKLVGMRFADVVAELAPAGVEQVRHWSGAAPE